VQRTLVSDFSVVSHVPLTGISSEIRFKDYGLKSIEVIDNGSGIAQEDYESVGMLSLLYLLELFLIDYLGIALKHHTSKLASFSDLTSVLTFGFRGEAISSLCALAECISVTTATAAQAPMGTVLTFDNAGRLTSHSGKVARQVCFLFSRMFIPLFHLLIVGVARYYRHRLRFICSPAREAQRV
jgi:hypothetical protein